MAITKYELTNLIKRFGIEQINQDEKYGTYYRLLKEEKYIKFRYNELLLCVEIFESKRINFVQHGKKIEIPEVVQYVEDFILICDVVLDNINNIYTDIESFYEELLSDEMIHDNNHKSYIDEELLFADEIKEYLKVFDDLVNPFGSKQLKVKPLKAYIKDVNINFNISDGEEVKKFLTISTPKFFNVYRMRKGITTYSSEIRVQLLRTNADLEVLHVIHNSFGKNWKEKEVLIISLTLCTNGYRKFSVLKDFSVMFDLTEGEIKEIIINDVPKENNLRYLMWALRKVVKKLKKEVLKNMITE